jgi:hypothetical protein
VLGHEIDLKTISPIGGTTAYPRTKDVRRLLPSVLALAFAAVAAVPASAADLHFLPAQVDVAVAQGGSIQFTIDAKADGDVGCTDTTVPVLLNHLFMVDRTGTVNAGNPGDVAITPEPSPNPPGPPPGPPHDPNPGHCHITNPVQVPLTVTAGADVPVGTYSTVIGYGRDDGDADDLDRKGPLLTIHVVEAPAPVVLPPPQLAPVQMAAPPTPTLGKTVLLTPVNGSTFYIVPGKPQATLTGPTVVPNGTIVDARTSVVKVTVVRDKTGALDSVDAWGGAFVVSQAHGARPITTLTLRRIVSPGKNNLAASAARKRRRHASGVGAKLWVNGKGNFKTSGDHGSAIVMGTYWLTQETATGTRVSVKEGVVAVRDFAHRRTIVLTQGRSYTATANAPKIRRRPVFTGSVP